MSLPAANTLAALRGALALIEASIPQPVLPAHADDGAPGFCIESVAARGALHEIAAAQESGIAQATGLVLFLAARSAQERATIWIAEDMALAENGAPYGPGLDEFGLAPERLVTVAVARGRDVPWAMEEALCCKSVGAVIGEVRSINRGIALTVTRRLSFAARRFGIPAYLLRAAPGIESSAASTRWIVRAVPSASLSRAPGPPAMHVRLVRNRGGTLGSWVVEWNRANQRYDIAAADREPLSHADFDRSHRAAAGS